MKNVVTNRGEMAAEILNARDHLLELLVRYKRSFGSDLEINKLIGFIAQDFKITGVEHLVETDVLAAADTICGDVISSVVALQISRRTNVG